MLGLNQNQWSRLGPQFGATLAESRPSMAVDRSALNELASQYWQQFQASDQAFNATQGVTRDAADQRVSFVAFARLIADLLPGEKGVPQLPGRLNFFCNQTLDQDQDGELSLNEWQSFLTTTAERVDSWFAQAKTLPTASIPDKKFKLSLLFMLGRSWSDGQYLANEAKGVGLSDTAQRRLAKRLDEGRVSLTQPSILSSFDLAQCQTQKTSGLEVPMAKRIGLAKAYDEQMALLKTALSAGQLKQLASRLLQSLAQVGQLPVWSDEDGAFKTFRTQSSAKTFTPGRETDLPVSVWTVESRLHELRTGKTQEQLKWTSMPWQKALRLSAIPLDAFRVKPATLSEKEIQSGLSLQVKAAQEQVSLVLLEALSSPDVNLPELVEALDPSVLATPGTTAPEALDMETWKNRLHQAAIPAFNAMKAALGITALDFNIYDSFLDEENKATGTPGLFDTTTTPVQVALNADAIAKRMGSLLKAPKLAAAEESAQRQMQLLYDFFCTLVEEMVHAHQHQMATSHEAADRWGYPPERVLDYRDTLNHHHVSAELGKAVFGESRHYFEQPLELDAKAIVQKTMAAFIPEYLQRAPAQQTP